MFFKTTAKAVIKLCCYSILLEPLWLPDFSIHLNVSGFLQLRLSHKYAPLGSFYNDTVQRYAVEISRFYYHYDIALDIL